MIKRTFNKQRNAQLAIMLSLLLIAPIGVKNCWGQAAGFAQSRSEVPATAQSGPRRSLLSQLNPFNRQSEQTAPLVDTTTISQPVATNMPPNALVAPRPQAQQPVQSRPVAQPSRPSAQRQTTTPSAPTAVKTPSASAGSIRSSLAARPSSKSVSSVKSSGTGGVASLLLDELEEEPDEIETVDVEASKAAPRRSVRRSLKANPFPSSLELLEDGEEDDEDETEDEEAGLSEDDEDDVLSTEEEDDELLDDEEETDDELESLDDSDGEPPLVAVVVEAESKTKKSVKRNASRTQTVAPEKSVKGRKIASTVENDNEASSAEDALEEVAVVDNRLEGVLPTNEVRASKSSESEAALSQGRAPNIEVDSLGPRKLTVGQSSTYTIRVRNVGSEVARKLVVTTDIPERVVNLRAVPSVGDASIQEENERGDAKQCVWRVGVLNPGDEQTLALSLTPTKRASFGLTSAFDFERPSTFAEVEVQEPILETLIEGRDSIEWGVEDRYRLRVRNIGNGDAENVTLNVSTGENEATQKIGLLRAGEEKTIEMSVKTVSEDFFVIDAQATGAYGLEAKATKKVTTLRGRLNVVVETPDLQFVDGEFEAIVRVRNDGDATLQNVDVVAQLPSGVEALSCSNQARRNEEKRRVYWVAPYIRPNEETSFSVVCRVNASGNARFEAVAVDQTGLVAQAKSVVNVESIAVLAMRVNAPKDPVAVGKTCVYELVVENNGTRDAHDINTGIFLGGGMKPLTVEDGRGYVYEEDSKALFKKIACLKAGESKVFRVHAEALAPGNQKVQAMLQSAPEDVSLLCEETTYCYSRRSTGDRDSDALTGGTLTARQADGAAMRK